MALRLRISESGLNFFKAGCSYKGPLSTHTHIHKQASFRGKGEKGQANERVCGEKYSCTQEQRLFLSASKAAKL